MDRRQLAGTCLQDPGADTVRARSLQMSLSSCFLTWPVVTVMRGRVLVSSVKEEEEEEEEERCCTGELTAGVAGEGRKHLG